MFAKHFFATKFSTFTRSEKNGQNFKQQKTFFFHLKIPTKKCYNYRGIEKNEMQINARFFITFSVTSKNY